MPDFRVRVRLGEHDILTDKDCDKENKCLDPVQDIEVEDRIKYPRYDPRKKINDIALLKLKTPVDVTKKIVRTICLPTESENQIGSLDAVALDNLGIAGDTFFFISRVTSNIQVIFFRLGSNRKWKSVERFDESRSCLRAQREMRRKAEPVQGSSL